VKYIDGRSYIEITEKLISKYESYISEGLSNNIGGFAGAIFRSKEIIEMSINEKELSYLDLRILGDNSTLVTSNLQQIRRLNSHIDAVELLGNVSFIEVNSSISDCFNFTLKSEYSDELTTKRNS